MTDRNEPIPDDGYFEGRFLDSKLTLLYRLGTPGPGYAVGHDGSLYRNGERVGEVRSVTFDRAACAFWVAYRSWRGSPLDMGIALAVEGGRGMSGGGVDLFAGAGGWDGAARELGIDPLGIELDGDACATREARGFRTLRADVSALDPLNFAPVRLVIASPPCPTFSGAGNGAGRLLLDLLAACMRDLAAGRDSRAEWRDAAYEILLPFAWERERKRAGKAKRAPDHARAERQATRDAVMSLLTVEPLRWALALRPELVALEQVPDVLPLWQITAALLEAAGYFAWTGKLEAERYGVPQTRERAILMASLSGPVNPPEPTHQRYVPGVPAGELTLDGIRPWVSMAEALGWGMVERPCVTMAAGTDAQGGPSALDGGSGSRATVARERERERERERALDRSDSGSRGARG